MVQEASNGRNPLFWPKMHRGTDVSRTLQVSSGMFTGYGLHVLVPNDFLDSLAGSWCLRQLTPPILPLSTKSVKIGIRPYFALEVWSRSCYYILITNTCLHGA